MSAGGGNSTERVIRFYEGEFNGLVRVEHSAISTAVSCFPLSLFTGLFLILIIYYYYIRRLVPRKREATWSPSERSVQTPRVSPFLPGDPHQGRRECHSEEFPERLSVRDALEASVLPGSNDGEPGVLERERDDKFLPL